MASLDSSCFLLLTKCCDKIHVLSKVAYFELILPEFEVHFPPFPTTHWASNERAEKQRSQLWCPALTPFVSCWQNVARNQCSVQNGTFWADLARFWGLFFSIAHYSIYFMKKIQNIQIRLLFTPSDPKDRKGRFPIPYKFEWVCLDAYRQSHRVVVFYRCLCSFWGCLVTIVENCFVPCSRVLGGAALWAATAAAVEQSTLNREVFRLLLCGVTVCLEGWKRLQNVLGRDTRFTHPVEKLDYGWLRVFFRFGVFQILWIATKTTCQYS